MHGKDPCARNIGVQATSRSRFLACGLVIGLASTACMAQQEDTVEVVRPEPLPTSCAPTYPPESKKAGEIGRVVLAILIDSHGVPSRAEIKESSGHKLLDEAALAASTCFRFRPATKAGVPIDMWMRAPINFVLEPPDARIPWNWRTEQPLVQKVPRATGNRDGFWDKFIRPQDEPGH